MQNQKGCNVIFKLDNLFGSELGTRLGADVRFILVASFKMIP